MGYVAVDDVAAYVGKVKEAGGVTHRGPTEIPNVGTFAVAGDPDGAGFLIFKGNSSEAPAYEPMGLGHVGWRELNAGDGERAFAFYGGLFGWQLEEAEGTPERYLTAKNAGANNGGMRGLTPPSPPSWLVYFGVEDIEQALARLAELGGTKLVGPIDIEIAKLAVVADPQGAVFALYAGEMEP